MKIEAVEKHLGFALKEQPDLTELMKYRSQNTFACDAEGNVTGLNLRTNKLTDKKIAFLQELPHLEALNLSENELTEIRFSPGITALRLLDLSENKNLSVIELPPTLKQLEALDLNECAVRTFALPPSPALRKLDLRKNALTSVNFNGDCPVLEWVDLSDNQLTEFALPFSFEGLKELHLKKNKELKCPSPEIVEQGGASVVVWFKAMRKDREKGKEPVFLKEIKILLVGEGKAGKTSLLKKFKDLPFDEHENQTHGVNVETLEFDQFKFWKKAHSLKSAKGRFWDFGGQEIMHASHQFFLTERSLYILLVDSRNEEKTEYWLRHIESYGGGSPAIVVMNKIEDNPNFNIEQRTLNNRYPFIENRFFKVSCRKNTGLDELRETIAATIPEMKRFKEPIPADWLLVKNDLEEETTARRYISRDRFLAICNNHDVTDPNAQSTLLEYLNDLGIVLHFKELGFNNIYVLDPHWVTIGVYKIINSSSIANGILQRSQLDYILNHESQKKEEEYDPNRQKSIKYNPEEQIYLVQIMAQFELLYELRQNEWLIPDLLPKEPKSEPVFDKKSALNFVLTYDFLPPSLITRFFIHMKSDLKDVRYIWRTGAVLQGKTHHCSALVQADKEQKRIHISVGGDEHQKREYFAVIRHALWQIHETFKGLTIREFMPVPGHPEELIEYAELLGKEKMDEDKLVIGKLGLTLSVKKDFLDKISTPEERKGEQSPLPPGQKEPVEVVVKEKKKHWLIKWGIYIGIIIAVLANLAQWLGLDLGDVLRFFGFQGW